MPPFEREPEPPAISHRTTARGLLFLILCCGLLAQPAAARTFKEPEPITGKVRPAPPAAVPAPKLPTIVFPVVGPVRYFDDFGAPRGGGSHQGNDIMAPKRALAVAAEAGKVKFWTTSWRAGCMLYLYGKSGTTYLYVHLNNDLTEKNDNKGECVPGTAYAKGLKSGVSVAAGQPIGFVGDSGDANGGSAHLHFEVHPGGKAAVSPFLYLKKARRLLFAAPPETSVWLSLKGTLVVTGTERLQLRVDSLRVSTGLRIGQVGRILRMRLPETALVEWVGGIPIAVARLQALKKGQPLTAWTEPEWNTLDLQLGKPDLLAVDRIVLDV